MKSKLTECKRSAKGFSLIEVVMAAMVLLVAVLGALAMIIVGIGRNSSNRMDTTATNVAQTVMEDIASVPANVTLNPAMTLTDCQNNNFPIQTALGGAPLIGRSIDFSQPPVAGYQMNYVMCGTNGLQVTYDVRWNIATVPQGGACTPAAACWAKEVTVAARQSTNVNNRSLMLFVPPVTLTTVVTQ